ncbi:MAG: 50S ribosomal protein L22 [Patescibacteria group bacterium]
MDTSAQLRFARLSPRKTKLVIDLVRGLPLSRALEQLKVMPQLPARAVSKLLNSAAANARHNDKVTAPELWIKRIEVGQGPVLKRWLPRAMGRATPLRRPTSHIKVMLTDQPIKTSRRKGR